MAEGKIIHLRGSTPDLRGQWHDLWARLGAKPDAVDREYDALAVRYDALHRHYHRLSCVATALRMLLPFRRRVPVTAALEAAIWFSHYVHYTYGDRLNRGFFDSAEAADRVLGAAGVAPATVHRVVTLVYSLDRQLTAVDPEELLIGDAMRFAVALPTERYRTNIRRLRREYKTQFDDDAWRHFRVALLERMLAQGVYRTPVIADALRLRATRNIDAEITLLRSGVILS